MSKIKDLNNTNFEATINDSQYPVIVDFWAEWCGPCKMIAPILEEISNEFEGSLLITKVNLDENQDLATKFSIRSIPSLLFFKDGELKDTKIGLSSKTDLLEWIKKNN